MSSRGRTSRTLSWPCSSATRRRCPRCTASTPAGASPRARTALERAGFSRGRARHHPGALLRHFAPRAFQADMDDTKLGVGPKEPRDAPARRSQAHSLFSYLPCDCTSTCLPARRSRRAACARLNMSHAVFDCQCGRAAGRMPHAPCCSAACQGWPDSKVPSRVVPHMRRDRGGHPTPCLHSSRGPGWEWQPQWRLHAGERANSVYRYHTVIASACRTCRLRIKTVSP